MFRNLIFFLYFLDVVSTCLSTEEWTSEKQNNSSVADHARSRTKMTFSEELWQATRTISAACSRHQDEVCRRRSAGENRCAERARAVSRPRSYDRPHRNTIYTMYNGGSASGELSQQPQFSLKNELSIACKSHSYLHQV